jgi:hypothetical protein
VIRVAIVGTGMDVDAGRARCSTRTNAASDRRRPETSGDGGRRVLELIAALYKSAFTAHPVRRGEIGAADPFYHSMNGDL